MSERPPLRPGTRQNPVLVDSDGNVSDSRWEQYRREGLVDAGGDAVTPGSPATPESPAALLRQAASRVRKLGAAATPGPWECGGHHGNDEKCIPPEQSVHGVKDATERRKLFLVVASGISDEDWPDEDTTRDYLMPGDAAWIATFGPQIAEPLAAWLDDAAQMHGEMIEAANEAWAMAESKSALAVARVLLGVPAPEETP